MNQPQGPDLDDPTVQVLLRAARGYRPPTRLHRRVRRALGLPLTFSLATTLAFASTGAGKVLLVTAAVIGVGGGGLVARQVVIRARAPVTRPRPIARASVEAPAVLAPTTAPRAEPTPAQPPVTAPSPARRVLARPSLPRQPPVEAVPDVVVPAQAPAIAAPLPPRPTAPSAELAAELDLLDRVQAAVRQRDFEAALGRIAEHERRFPRGALAQETDVLRISALLGAGQRREAARRARLFLLRNGDGVLGERVKAMLSAIPETSTGESR